MPTGRSFLRTRVLIPSRRGGRRRIGSLAGGSASASARWLGTHRRWLLTHARLPLTGPRLLVVHAAFGLHRTLTLARLARVAGRGSPFDRRRRLPTGRSGRSVAVCVLVTHADGVENDSQNGRV